MHAKVKIVFLSRTEIGKVSADHVGINSRYANIPSLWSNCSRKSMKTVLGFSKSPGWLVVAVARKASRKCLPCLLRQMRRWLCGSCTGRPYVSLSVVWLFTY